VNSREQDRYGQPDQIKDSCGFDSDDATVWSGQLAIKARV